MINTLVGAGFGFFISFLVWFITKHMIVPGITFEENIGKRDDERSDGGAIYRIRFCNSGRRKIVDVSIFARMYVQGLDGRALWRKRIIIIPLRIAHWPKLDIDSGTYGSTLCPEKTKELAEPWYPEEVQQKAQAEQMTLEDIFALGSNAELQIDAFAYDDFSGARKVFSSKKYTIKDIKEE